MTGSKNIFMIKWFCLLVLALALAPVSILGKILSHLPLNYPHTNVNFYSLPSTNGQPGKNLNESLSSKATINEAEDSNLNALIPEDPHDCQSKQFLQCNSSNPYRTMNGSCNNLNHPTWGVSKGCYLRFQPAFFEGFGDYRKSAKGGPLPDLRNITLGIFTNVHRPSPNVSFMFTIYGQTVAHDFSRVEVMNLRERCCPFASANHPSCSAVPVTPKDPFYKFFNITCLPMHRSRPCTRCNTTNREQINAGTAFLDGSMIYGTSDRKIKSLRANDGTGKMILNETEHGELLPTDPDPFIVFCPQKKNRTCFFSGDIRVNQHAILTGITTYIVKEHNRLAKKLKEINPHWEEEKLFQESRRINTATLQCITYKEFLPLLLGQNLMDQFNLTVGDGSHGSKYNPNIQPGVRNEFATAAFRLHSMIPKTVGSMNLNFKDMYFNPETLRAGNMETIMKGVCKVPTEMYDSYYMTDVTNYMAKNPGIRYGNDLSSVDIQRGRDHGLPPYIVMVRFCSEGQIIISNFNDLAPLLMTRLRVDKLKQHYTAVEDIDLWVGVQMEHHFPGAEVSPTAACIIAKQFYFAKYGDRFFFEHEEEVPSFTTAQRQSLKQCSLSRLLCDNSDMTHIQKKVMLLPSVTNPEVPCETIAEIDLSHWAEKPPRRT